MSGTQADVQMDVARRGSRKASGTDEDKKLKLIWSNIMQQDAKQADEETGGTQESSSQLDPANERIKQAALAPSKSTNLMKIEIEELRAKAKEPGAVEASRKTLAGQYTWDVVFVFKVGSSKDKVKVWDPDKGEHVDMTQEEHFRSIIADTVCRLEDAGLYTDLWYSVQHDEVYCRVGASELRLQQEADRTDFDLQLDHTKCLEYAKALGVKLAEYTSSKNGIITEKHWYNLYGPYKQLDPDNAFRQELYLRYNTEDPHHPRYNSFFTATDRLKLTFSMVEADDQLGGAGISFGKAVSNPKHPLKAVFPLHDEKDKNALHDRWMTVRASFQAPLSHIRAYFGEAIAFYFAFLAYYNRSLILPGLVGLAFFIYQLVDGRVDVPALPAFAVFIALWATLFLEVWKRNECKYRVRWGMSSFLTKEQPRPEFYGEWRPSPIDGKQVEVFPLMERIRRALLSQTVVWTLIGIVIASVVGIMLFRKIVVEWSPKYGTLVTAFINAIQIMILNVVYGKVSHLLNDWENHRTDSEWENALIAKTFLFKFVNSYNSLFYIAFLKKHDSSVNGCANDDCLKELQQQLGTIFVTAVVVNNALEVLVPMIQNRMASRENDVKLSASSSELEAAVALNKKKSTAEEQFELVPYESTFDDFDELVIQYGYVTLFVVAFPIAPLLALFNNIFEARIDATKLLKLTRRPEPRGAANIGTWFDILNTMSFIAVIVNAAIICFATPVMSRWISTDVGRAYAFILAEHIIFIVKFAIAYFVPDEPEEFVQHLARQEYVVGVLINGVDEDNDDLAKDGLVVAKRDFDWTRISDQVRATGHEHE